MGNWLGLISLVIALPSAVLAVIDIRERSRSDRSPSAGRPPGEESGPAGFTDVSSAIVEPPQPPSARPAPQPLPAEPTPPRPAVSAPAPTPQPSASPARTPQPSASPARTPRSSASPARTPQPSALPAPTPLSFWRRLLSYSIDVYSAWLPAVLVDDPAVALAIGLPMWGLYVAMTATSGRSIGRYVVGGQVVHVGPHGYERVGLRRAALRGLVSVIPGSVLFINPLSTLADDQRRGFNDRIASTAVLLVRGRQPLAGRPSSGRPTGEATGPEVAADPRPATAPPPGPGWYHATGDPVGTHRYWDGQRWQGGPERVG